MLLNKRRWATRWSQLLISALLIFGTQGVGQAESSSEQVFGKIALLSRRDVGVDRRISIEVMPTESNQASKRQILEFSVDGNAVIKDRSDTITFGRLTLGQLVRVTLTEDLEGNQSVVAIDAVE